MADLKTEHTFYVGDFEERTLDGHASYASVQKTRVSAGVLHVRKLRKAPATGAETAFEYLHRDHLGSVDQVTDADGVELLVLSHDPFGSRRKSDWTRRLTDSEHGTLTDALKLQTSEGFSGHEHLERTGLVHMGGHVYDPELMRFLSPDPVVTRPTSSQSWNSYGYAMNSPLSYVDPTGLTFAPVDPGCSVFLSACNPGGQGGGFSRGTQSLPSTLLYIQYGTFISWAPSVGYYGGEIAFGLQPIAFSYLFARAGEFLRDVAVEEPGEADEPMDIAELAIPGQVVCKMACHGVDYSDRRYATNREEFWLEVATVFVPMPLGANILTLGSKGQWILRGLRPIGPAKRESGLAVLGSYPDYIRLSDDLYARRFDIPPTIWARMSPDERWVANQKFLDRLIRE